MHRTVDAYCTTVCLVCISVGDHISQWMLTASQLLSVDYHTFPLRLNQLTGDHSDHIALRRSTNIIYQRVIIAFQCGYTILHLSRASCLRLSPASRRASLYGLHL